ncbi:6-phosphogluconolactonase [Legionella cardiaca]|uniref:6-phosphogluconolactonase n=1 Tax=Legionella cardiaca TaxID=1071983 RepID=A0ABY8AW88_9GAMM|nr:6-phosphogluconolactonase [Legionella cardiaca]WED44441.1 6-phosphogluconolactonase [Legionella cardiaca]
MQIHHFDKPEQLNQHFAQTIVSLLANAIAERGQAFLVVSGGKTPLGLFQMLAKTNLSWEKVVITLADERCLSPAENDSNERMVRNHLLQHNAAKATFISLYNEDNSFDIEARLSLLPTFDVVILGMGEDGHTASLFPCSDEIENGLADEASTTLMVNPKTASHKRISLSKTRLLKSRAIFLHLVGKKKLEVLNKALDGKDPLEMPIRAFLHHPATNVQVMFAP